MQEFEFDVKFYETKDGAEPIRDFIEKLKKSAATNREAKARVKKIYISKILKILKLLNKYNKKY